MDKRKARRLDRIGDGEGAGEDPVKAEEERRWEGWEKKTTDGNCTGRGDNDYGDYAPPHLEYESAVALYDSEPTILFAFGPRYAGSPPKSKG